MLIGSLLFAGVAVELLSSLGVLLGRTPFDRLHFVGPAAVLGGLLITAAVLVQDSLSQSAVKTVLILLAVLMTGPIVSHAIARAAFSRDKPGGPRR